MINISKEELNKILDEQDDTYEGRWEFGQLLDNVLSLRDVNTAIEIIGECDNFTRHTDFRIEVFDDIKFTFKEDIELGQYDLEEVYEGSEYWKDWELHLNTDTGDFDSEKGAMCDFECDLYFSGIYLGSGVGDNYYTGSGGPEFYSSITFKKPVEKQPIDRQHIIYLFNNKHNTDDDKVDNLIKYIESYYDNGGK